MELYNISNMLKVWSNYFITVRRVSLTCKFPCVALPFVCLAIIALHKRRLLQSRDLYWWRIA
ncbi:hypothetical protein T02_7806 [Trichinella nativa]|uniref:Uncharacterized protein n=1 Tax=Trichinella nativa TaxID=6335 RepID=A0A0V1KJD5_9BILA|nr:hypothetical protein T02_7806 [Trichinella nativa]